MQETVPKGFGGGWRNTRTGQSGKPLLFSVTQSGLPDGSIWVDPRVGTMGALFDCERN